MPRMNRPNAAALRAPVVALMLTVGGAASAQDTTSNIEEVTVDNLSIPAANSFEDDQRYVINLETCRDIVNEAEDVQITWDLADDPPSDAQYSIKIRQGSETCTRDTLSAEADDECLTVPEFRQQDLDTTSLRTVIDYADLFGDLQATADCESLTQTRDVILVFTDLDTTSEDLDYSELRFEFDTARPGAPSGLTATAGESSIRIDWDEVDGADSYTVYYATTAFSGGVTPESVSTSSETTTSVGLELTEDLVTDADYYLAVTVTDATGNESLLSDVVSATTQPVTDFWEYYRSQGGPDEGGFCATAPTRGGHGAALLGLAGLAGLMARRRRHRRSGDAAHGLGAGLVAVAALGVALTPADAAADDDDIQTPISGQLEIKFGSYLPEIDAGFQATPGPYETIFGAGGSLYFEVEYDYYLWREYGVLAIGFGLGYSSNTGNGLLEDGTASVDETSFKFLPLRLSAIYRFDMLARDFGIPLTFYVKGGIDYYIWWAKSAAGIATYRDPETGELDEARGGTWGWHTAVGVQFLLDFLAPEMSRSFDASVGVNNSYLFGEWLLADVDDFGAFESLRLGDSAFLFGLAFEF
jgi:MYXO-CTERM domain-containing protein